MTWVALASATWIAGGVWAANTGAGGPDLIGWAAVITAASGAFGTLVMAVVTLVRLFRGDVTKDDITEAVQKGLAQQGDDHAP